MADEADFDFGSLGAKKALRDYNKAVAEDKKAQAQRAKEAEAEGAKAAKRTRDAFVENLQKALKKSMQSGNLDEANKINAAIKALEKGASPAGGSAAGSKGKKKAKKSKARIANAVGVWRKSDGSLYFIIRPDGTAHHSANIEGVWKPINKSDQRFAIKWRNGVIDQITISDDGQSLVGVTPGFEPWGQMLRDAIPVGRK
jgi:hypothetical protein